VTAGNQMPRKYEPLGESTTDIKCCKRCVKFLVFKSYNEYFITLDRYVLHITAAPPHRVPQTTTGKSLSPTVCVNMVFLGYLQILCITWNKKYTLGYTTGNLSDGQLVFAPYSTIKINTKHDSSATDKQNSGWNIISHL
jgi:hypothetical protein